MNSNGPLIAIEGIDGSGKRTQLELLHLSLSKEGRPHRLLSFPRYESFFGELVARYLDGDLGNIQQISPYLSALPFAADRFEARREILDELEAGTLVVADRYVGSNLAYQGSKLPRHERQAFRLWLEKLEYEVFRIPRPSLTIFFNMPVDVAAVLMEKRARRRQKHRLPDVYERDLDYLRAVNEEFLELAKTLPNWRQIEMVDRGGNLRDPQQIHHELVDLVWGFLSPQNATSEVIQPPAGPTRFILAVEEKTIARTFGNRQFIPAGAEADFLRQTLLTESMTLPRSELEEDLSKKQLVACAMIRHAGRVALFKRSWNGNRREMQLRWSLLVGGHLDSQDMAAEDPFNAAISRELEEEIRLPAAYSLELAGFVNDDRNTVARTHVCAVYLLDVPTEQIEITVAGALEYETEQSLKFVGGSELTKYADALDPWSEILARELLGLSIATQPMRFTSV